MSRRGSRIYERVETINGHLFITLKSGRRITFWHALEAAERAHTDLGRALSRAFKLAGHRNPDLADYQLERLEWFIDTLESHIGAIREEIEKRRGVKSQEERIAILRNVTGRTPEEAAAFNRKADELELRLHEATR